MPRIERSVDLIKTADWIIDMGREAPQPCSAPEGAERQ